MTKYRFNIDEYHRMGEAYIIPYEKRVELINGEIFEVDPITSLHSGTVKLLARIFNDISEETYIISIRNPVGLNRYSELDPDIAILNYRDDFYTKSHPKPDEVLLIIEVADSSLEKDRTVKLPLYATAGIKETWIVNLQDQQIEVSTEPSPKGYANCHIYRKGDMIHTDLIKELAVDKVFLE